MKKRVSKKLVSILACVGLIAGFASLSNAYTFNTGVNSGGGSTIYKQNISTAGTRTYSYSITYIKYDGLAVGAHMPGMSITAVTNGNTVNICSVNSNSKSGSYSANSGYTYYNLSNNTGRYVSIRGSFFG